MAAADVIKTRIQLQGEDLKSLSQSTGIDVGALKNFLAGGDLQTNQLSALVDVLWQGAVALEDEKLFVRKSMGLPFLDKMAGPPLPPAKPAKRRL
jgi:hypothetical protein